MQMKTRFLIFFFLPILAVVANGQVIYERTYPDVSPYIEKLFELSDHSTVSFSYSSACPFMEWLLVDANGNLNKHEGLGYETVHSFDARKLEGDNILVSYRMGPLDYPGDNSFNVELWTPTDIITIVEDPVSYAYWEDMGFSYGAYSIYNDKIIYQKVDTLFLKNLFSGDIERKVIQSNLLSSGVFPVLDHLLVYPATGPPTLYDQNLQPAITWNNSMLPGDYAVSIDSFMVGVSAPGNLSLHIINAFDESFRDLDLSTYFTQILSLSVENNILIVRGNAGTQPLVLKLDSHFIILAQSNLDIPMPKGINEMTLMYFPDRVYSWGYDGLDSYRMSYQYPDAHPIQYIDLALDSIWVDSVFYWPPEQHLPAKVFMLCKVSNHSAEPIQNFAIFYQDQSFSECDPGVYPRYIEGLNIPPGQSATFMYQNISWKLPVGDPFIRTFIIKHPNYHLDSTYSNNIYTVSYFPTDIDEPLQSPVAVFPNPFIDLLTTSIQSIGVELILFDQMGKIVSSGQDQLDHLSDLPVGIYFLQVYDGQQLLVRKVVKVE